MNNRMVKRDGGDAYDEARLHEVEQQLLNWQTEYASDDWPALSALANSADDFALTLDSVVLAPDVTSSMTSDWNRVIDRYSAALKRLGY